VEHIAELAWERINQQKEQTLNPTDSTEEPVSQEDFPHLPPPIMYGASLDRESAEALTRQTISPEIFDMCPMGNLLFCVEEPEPEDYGLIRMAKNFKEPSGIGYIIAAGPQAGISPQPGGIAAIGVLSNYPSDLLGLHVLFGKFVGVPIQVNLTETNYTGQVIMMPSRDIQCIDRNPIPLGERIQKKILGQSDLVTQSGEPLILESN